MAKTKKTTKTTDPVEMETTEVKSVIMKAIVKFNNKAFEITYNVTTDNISVKEVE